MSILNPFPFRSFMYMFVAQNLFLLLRVVLHFNTSLFCGTCQNEGEINTSEVETCFEVSGLLLDLANK